MATRRARFKPVLLQPARRGRSAVTDVQPSDGTKEVITSTQDPPDKNCSTPTQQDAKSEELKSTYPKTSPSKEAVPAKPEKPQELPRTPVIASSKTPGDGTPAPEPALKSPPPPPLPRPASPAPSSSESSSVAETTARPAKDPAKDSAKDPAKGFAKETSSGRQRRPASSSNQRALAARRTIMKLAKDGPPQRSSLTMFDLIFYNPVTNPMTNKSPPPPKIRDRTPSICSVGSIQDQRLEEEKEDDVDVNRMKESEDKENKEEEEVAVPVPRVKVGPDGRIIIDEQSLVIETTESKKTRAEMEKSEVVFDSGFSNGFYKRSKRTKDWSNRETLKFYRALHVYGTDFSLMQVLFKDRTRRELKLKFKKEERMRMHLIDKALCSPLDFDTSELEKEALEEEEEEARRLAKEKEEKDNPKPKPKPKPAKANRKPCSLAQREMPNEDAEGSCPEKPPPKKKRVRKPKSTTPKAKEVVKAKEDSQDEGKANRKGLDLFDDVVLPTDPVPRSSGSGGKAAKATARKKRKAPQRDPANPASASAPKKPKKGNVLTSPESDHSYAASPLRAPQNGATPATPTTKTPNKKTPPVTPPRPHNKDVAAQSPGFLTIDLSNHILVTPTRTIAVSPNEFMPSQIVPGTTPGTVATPKPAVSINIVHGSGLPFEFASPTAPLPNRAVPVALTSPPVHPPSTGPLVTLQQTPTNVEPGSFYVLQTQCPDDPKRHVLGVYMVTNNQCKAAASPAASPLSSNQMLVQDALKPTSSDLVSSEEIVRDPIEGTVLTKL